MSPAPQPTDTLLTDDAPPDGAPPDPKAHGPFAAIRRALPAGEVIRFLMVGVSNTLFSLGFYSACVIVYSHLLPHYGKPLIADIASITSKPVCITVAFLCYKHFVFRTRGHFLKEWLRCFAVYGVSTPAELIILPIATSIFLHIAPLRASAPFLAGVVNSLLIAVYSYFAHKKFSFRR
ncbi:MAG: GtrA family protein [Acidobacteriaceae bacterium]|jgi:putative flippase GtrA